MPHGPANAVLVAAPAHSHGPFGCAGGSAPTASGWPARKRVVSGSGPFGPIFIGVWQSPHATTVTRYLPRATRSVDGVDAAASTLNRVSRQPAAKAAARATAAIQVVLIRLTPRGFVRSSETTVKVPG